MVAVARMSLFAPGAPGPSYRWGVVLVLLAGTCWSSMGIAVRSMEVANVWQILFYRSCAMAPVLFLLLSLRSGGKPLVVIRRAGLAGVIGGSCLVVAFAGGIYAIQTTSVANAMFLFASAPFMAAILGRMLLKEQVPKSTWTSIALAMIGIAIMVTEGVALGHAVGNLAALGSALGFAGFTITLRWGKQEDMLPAVFLSGLFAIVIASAVCLLQGHGLAIPLNDIVIASMLGVFQLALGLTLYTLGSRAVPAAELALLSTSEVLLAPLWVWLFLGEGASPYTFLGGAVLMSAIVASALVGFKRNGGVSA